MKVNYLNYPITPKLYKQGEAFLRSNRSMQKLPFSSHSKINILNQNKQPSLICLINSLHSCLNEDKIIPKSYVKKIIQILSHNQIKSNLLENYRNTEDKIPQQKNNFIKRLHTQEVNENTNDTERWIERKQASRIRKIRTRKILQNPVVQQKQTQNEEIQQNIQKRIAVLQQKLEQFKEATQENQRELKGKQELLVKSQLQKQQTAKEFAKIMKDELSIEKSLKSDLDHLTQQFQDTKRKFCQLKNQLIERESQITCYWLSALKQGNLK